MTLIGPGADTVIGDIGFDTVLLTGDATTGISLDYILIILLNTLNSKRNYTHCFRVSTQNVVGLRPQPGFG